MLLTRAPVADKCIATSSLPLDLHVLGLSLAFILSQDQTLLCISFFISSKLFTSSFISSDIDLISITLFFCYTNLVALLLVFCLFKFIKDRFLFVCFSSTSFGFKASAKVMVFLLHSKYFTLFFSSFFQENKQRAINQMIIFKLFFNDIITNIRFISKT